MYQINLKRLFFAVLCTLLNDPVCASNPNLKRLYDDECVVGQGVLKCAKSQGSLQEQAFCGAMAKVIQKHLCETTGLGMVQLDETSIDLIEAKMASLNIKDRAKSVWLVDEKLACVQLPDCSQFHVHKTVKMIMAVCDKTPEDLDLFLQVVQSVYNYYFSSLTFDHRVYRSLFMTLSGCQRNELKDFKDKAFGSNILFSRGVGRLNVPNNGLAEVYKQTFVRCLKGLKNRLVDVDRFMLLFSIHPKISMAVLEDCRDEPMETVRTYVEAASQVIDPSLTQLSTLTRSERLSLQQMIQFHRLLEARSSV